MSALPETVAVGGTVERRLWRRLLASRSMAISLAILALFGLLALAAPLISPTSLDDASGRPYAPPSAAHPLGLDDAGVDMVTILLHGARATLLVALTAALVATIVGGAVGIAAGYAGGWFDNVLMRVTDYVIVVPYLPLLVTVAAIAGSSTFNVIVVIGLISWTNTALVVRAQVRSLAARRFIERSRTLGASHVSIVRRHVLAHVAPLIAASGSLTVATAVFAEAALAFIGLGDPSRASWGQSISNAFERSAISNDAWWAVVPPGLCIGIVVLTCTLAGRGLEAAVDPRLESSLLGPRAFRVLARGERPS